MALLEVSDLRVYFPVTRRGLVRGTTDLIRAVDGVGFRVSRGQTLGLVGESGCGKTTTGRAVLQLIRPTSGSVRFDGVDLTKQWRLRFGRWVWTDELRSLRRRVQVIFQDSHASLNPRMTVEDIVADPLRIFRVASGPPLRARVEDLLERVGLDGVGRRRYPHELSGGQRQRVGIARALALEPELIVADEPVSALDASVQAQVLNLLLDLQRDLDLTYVFIGHDLAALRHVCDRIAVMYLGRVVENAPVDALFERPSHPYTHALISAIPVPDPKAERARRRLVLSGDVPSPAAPPPGCTFHPRCPDRIDRCRTERPLLNERAEGHHAACHVTDPSRAVVRV